MSLVLGGNAVDQFVDERVQVDVNIVTCLLLRPSDELLLGNRRHDALLVSLKGTDDDPTDTRHLGRLRAGRSSSRFVLGTMVLHALALTKKDRPRVCLVNTAVGDDALYYAKAYEAFNCGGL